MDEKTTFDNIKGWAIFLIIPLLGLIFFISIAGN